MKSTDLQTIASFGMPHEAEIARATLEANGITAYVIGAEIGTMLSHVGTALGGVKLQVAAEDVSRAKQEIASLADTSETPAWRCARCGNDVDAGFLVCWSCDNSFSSDQVTPATDADSSPRDTLGEAASATDAVEGAADDLNASDASTQRAWRAAVLGTVFPPLLIYALVLLIFLIQKPLSPSATTRFYKTFFLIVVVLGGYYVLFRSM